MGRLIRRALALSFVALVFATGARAEPTHYYDHTVTLGRIPVFAGTDTFAAPDGRTGRLTLKVTGRVEGFVTFNNAVVAAPRDLTPGATIVRTVPLLAMNRISAALAGRQGGSIRGYVTLAPEASQTINAATGGCIETPKLDLSAPASAKICVPAGSLSQNTTIEIYSRMESIVANDEFGHQMLPAGQAIEFEPSGTVFAIPAIITLSYIPEVVSAYDPDGEEVRLFGQEELGNTPFEVADYEADSDSSTVTATISSFTTFQPVVVPTLYSNMASQFDVGDLNGDGIEDMVLFRSSGSPNDPSPAPAKIIVRLGQDANNDGKGDVTFGSTEYTFSHINGVYPVGIRVADFDTDGKRDAVVSYCNWYIRSCYIKLFKGNGDGTVTASTTANLPNVAVKMWAFRPTATSNSTSLMISGLYPTTCFYLMNCTVEPLATIANYLGGTFQFTPFRVVGWPSLVYVPGVGYRQYVTAYGFHLEFGFADFNGDGVTDIATERVSGSTCKSLEVFVTQGTVFRYSFWYEPYSVTPQGQVVCDRGMGSIAGAGKFTEDSNADVLTNGGLFKGNGNGTFSFPNPYLPFTAGYYTPFSPAVADTISGNDNITDVVWQLFAAGSPGYQLRLYSGNQSVSQPGQPNGLYTFDTSLTPPGYTYDLRTADFNNDGCKDIAGLYQTYPGNVVVYLNSGVNCAFDVIITDFHADPPAIDAGEWSDLTWTTINADSCEITNDRDATVYTVPAPDLANGTWRVYPTQTTTYHLHCDGANGSFDDADTLVTVNAIGPYFIGLGGTGIAAANAVSAFPDNSVVAAGVFQGNTSIGPIQLSTSTNDAWVAKLDSSGNPIWAIQSSSTGSGVGVAYDVATAQSGVTYVSGVTYGVSSFGSVNLDVVTGSFYVVQLDQLGNPTWGRQMVGAASSYANRLATTPDNSVIVSGFYNVGSIGSVISLDNISISSPCQYCEFLAKYNANGGIQWISVYGNAYVLDMKMTSSGNIVVSGYYFNDLTSFGGTILTTSWGQQDGFIMSLDSTGHEAWLHTMNGPGYEICDSVIVENDDEILASCFGQSAYTYYDGSTSRVPPNNGGYSSVNQFDSSGNLINYHNYFSQMGTVDILASTVVPNGQAVYFGNLDGVTNIDGTLVDGKPITDATNIIFSEPNPGVVGNIHLLSSYTYGGNGTISDMAALPDGNVVAVGAFNGVIGNGTEFLTSQSNQNVLIWKFNP